MEDVVQAIRLELEQEVHDLVESHRTIANLLSTIEDMFKDNVSTSAMGVIKTVRAHCLAIVNDSDSRKFREAAKNAADKVSKWESWKKEGLQFAEIRRDE